MAGGQLPPPQADVLAPSRSTQIAQTAEQRLAEMGISKPVKPERLDFTTAKQYEADLASYNDALNKQRQAIFEEKKVSTADKKAAPAVLKDLENSIKTIDRAIEQSNKLNTGFVGGRTVLGANVNPFANDLQGTLGTIQARTALDSLVQAKERGATFGALSDAELQLLKDRTASLDRSQSQEQLDANLKEIREMYSGIAGKIKQAAGMQDKPTAANVDGKLKAAGYSEAQIRAYKQAKGIK
jgi:phosphoglycerate-specific signal transduction histidine kinase